MPVINKKIPCPYCDTKIDINPTTQNPQNLYCSSCKNKAEGFLRYFELENEQARKYYDRKFAKDKLLFLSVTIVITVAFFVIFLMMPYINLISGNGNYNLTMLLLYTLLTPIVTAIFTVIPLIKNKNQYAKNEPVKIYFYKDFIVINNKIVWDRLIKKTKLMLSESNKLIEIIQTGSFGNKLVPAHYDSIEIDEEFIKEESYLLDYYKRK